MDTHLNSIKQTTLIMDLIAQRQKVLATNLANMDTPGYIRKDISFSQYLNGLNSPLETKLSAKLGTTPILLDNKSEGVVAADELAEMQKNSVLYTVATRRMSSMITQMKTVINMGS